jgi:hypothetical protein
MVAEMVKTVLRVKRGNRKANRVAIVVQTTIIAITVGHAHNRRRLEAILFRTATLRLTALPQRSSQHQWCRIQR